MFDEMLIIGLPVQEKHQTIVNECFEFYSLFIIGIE